MRVVRVPAPIWWEALLVPQIAGGVLAGFGFWRFGVPLLAAGAVAYFLGAAWWVRRLRAVGAAEGLTTRDIVEVEYPRWARVLTGAYLTFLAGLTGLFIVAAVVFVVVALVQK